MKPLIIVGAGGFGREIQWLLGEVNRQSNRGMDDLPAWHVLGFVDRNVSGRIGGLPVLGDDDWVFRELDQSQVRFFVAVGDPVLRHRISSMYLEQGFNSVRLQWPGAAVCDDLKIGQGSVVCAGAVVTSQVKIGNFSLVNLNATIGHDCEVGSYVNIHPGAHLNGRCKVGDGAEIGSGAIILPGIVVGEGAVIGAGAVVTKDVPAGETQVGVPAKPMKL